MKKATKIILTILIVLLGLLIISPKVQAAGVSISSSKSSATVGDNVTINVSVTAATWNLRVSGNGISGDSIVGFDSDGENTSFSRSFTLNTASAGTYTIRVSGDVTDGSTDANSAVDKSVTVTVSPAAPSDNGGSSSSSSSSGSSSSSSSSRPSSSSSSSSSSSKPKEEEKKSNDCSLKSLEVEDYELYPEFSSDTKEYNIKVPNDVTEIDITATPNHNKASCKIEGDMEDLQVGENEFVITVTAENGESSVYKLIVNREREALTVLSLKITYIDEEGNTQEVVINPEFDPEFFEYTIDNLSYLVSQLDIEVVPNLEEAEIEIVGNEDLLEGENLITITVTMPSEGEEEDEVLTYEITVNKEPTPKLTIIGKIKKWFKGITGTVGTWVNNNIFKIVDYSLAFCSGAMFVLSILLVIDYKKYKKLLAKVSEITKMNSQENSMPEATEFAGVEGTTESTEINNEPLDESPNFEDEIEEIEEEKRPKSKGRHF